MSFSGFLLIGLGGALGSMLRGFTALFFSFLSPWPTLFVNIVGAFVIGLLVKQMEGTANPESFRNFWIIGVCGGFTTFSAFGLEIVEMLKSSQWTMSSVYLFLNVLGSVLAIFMAFRLFSFFQS